MLTMCMQHTQGLKEGTRAGVTGNFEHLVYSGSGNRVLYRSNKHV